MFTLSRSHCQTLSKKCNEKIIWAKEKKKASNWLHSFCIWPSGISQSESILRYIWNISPYEYLQPDEADHIHRHWFSLDPKRIIAFIIADRDNVLTGNQKRTGQSYCHADTVTPKQLVQIGDEVVRLFWDQIHLVCEYLKSSNMTLFDENLCNSKGCFPSEKSLVLHEQTFIFLGS